MYKDLTNRYESAKKAQSEMRQDVHNLRKVHTCSYISYNMIFFMGVTEKHSASTKTG